MFDTWQWQYSKYFELRWIEPSAIHMGVRQGLGTLIKQKDNKAQLEKTKGILSKKKKNGGIVIRKLISKR